MLKTAPLTYSPYQQHSDELKIILNHILILCGNDKAMYDYFIGWISKMIQQPHIKLTCMVLISKYYIKQVEDTVVFMSRRDMKTSYEHIQCGYDIVGDPVSFIEKWMVNNKTINVKDTMDIYPDVENCPPNVFPLSTT